MRTLVRSLVVALAIAVLAPLLGSAQIVFDGTPGTLAPPGTLGPFTMVAFADDTRANFLSVSYASGPDGDITFSPSLTHTSVGGGWATWSHGYTGDVYYTTGTSATITMPPNTVAFYFYAEPNFMSEYTMSALAQDGSSSGNIEVNGAGGAKYFGFYTTNGVALESITITAEAAAAGFAVGEFGIFQCVAPVLAVSVTPDVIWSPNHKMADIEATVTASDGTCGGNVITLVSVTSNEADNGDDDGNTVDDVQGATAGTADYAFQVRKERSGTGTGRVYTATYQVVDNAGFTVTESATITVPLNSMAKRGDEDTPDQGSMEYFAVYPNPASTSTTVQFPSVTADATVEVLSLNGQVLSTHTTRVASGTAHVEISVADVPAGIYVARVRHGDSMVSLPLTIIR
jgi:hypothetical protein